MSHKKKNEYRIEYILIVVSFLMGGIGMLILIRFTPLVNVLFRDYIITKNETKIFEKNSLSESVKKIYDAVTVIEGYYNESLAETGTGFIYKVDDKYGYIITNEHVLENTNEVKVVLTTEEEKKAEVLGKDEYLDLAVLRIEKKGIKQVANIGSSDKVNLGDTIFTIGTPLGYDYRGSITSGILSGKERMVAVNSSSEKTDDWMMKVLQTDASINPGNSGGPLLNASGEVIGICTLKLIDSEIEGMGFAIPIEDAMSHIDLLEKGEKIKWPVLGINMVNLSDTSSIVNNQIEVPTAVKEGIIITGTKDGTDASSKLKKGDIITHINNDEVKDIAHLRYELYQYKPDDSIIITILRNDKEKKIKVKLSE